MAEKIKAATGNSTQLHKSYGGVFEVTVDDKLIYSKKATGVFPKEVDIIDMLKNR
ncbi:MAG: SelT/SelW/SelH family protein [Xanthomonadaceae bacterium]|nr:SelT/SelW/SelH family protein [Xanthomonadaceae bacterium]